MAKTKKKAAETGAPWRLAKLNMDDSLGGDRRQVSADLLYIGDANMRRDHAPDNQLIASLSAHGQLHDLIVRQCADHGRPPYEIIDGGRRYASICEGIRAGSLDEGFLIKVRIDNDATKEQSVAANLHMAAHPLDTCEAILELAKTAEDETAIAAHFGQTVLWVQRNAKLAGLSDKAKEAYRAGRMGLDAASLMTRLPHKEQDKLVKGKDGIAVPWVKEVIAQGGVDSSIALFDWKATYPPEKIQRSLFEDIVMLLDKQEFKTFQDAAVEERIKGLEGEGYTVVRLKRDDYLMQGKYVTYTGRVTEEGKKTLSWLVKVNYSGLEWSFTGPVMLAKDAKKIARNKGGKDTTDEPPKALTAKDLSPVQTEILNGHIIADIRLRVATGKADEAIIQWIVIAQAIGNRCHWVGPGIAPAYNGTDARWAKLQKDHPGEFVTIDAAADRAGLESLTWDKFKAMTPKQRHAAYLVAVASILLVPLNVRDPHMRTAKNSGVNRVTPGEAFFKRWRTDQLLDYLKKSGAKDIDKIVRKADAVTAAIAIARTFGGWQFGIDKA